jgi:hypothetical protein
MSGRRQKRRAAADVNTLEHSERLHAARSQALNSGLSMSMSMSPTSGTPGATVPVTQSAASASASPTPPTPVTSPDIKSPNHAMFLTSPSQVVVGPPSGGDGSMDQHDFQMLKRTKLSAGESVIPGIAMIRAHDRKQQQSTNVRAARTAAADDSVLLQRNRPARVSHDSMLTARTVGGSAGMDEDGVGVHHEHTPQVHIISHAPIRTVNDNGSHAANNNSGRCPPPNSNRSTPTRDRPVIRRRRRDTDSDTGQGAGTGAGAGTGTGTSSSNSQMSGASTMAVSQSSWMTDSTQSSGGSTFNGSENWGMRTTVPDIQEEDEDYDQDNHDGMANTSTDLPLYVDPEDASSTMMSMMTGSGSSSSSNNNNSRNGNSSSSQSSRTPAPSRTSSNGLDLLLMEFSTINFDRSRQEQCPICLEMSTLGSFARHVYKCATKFDIEEDEQYARSLIAMNPNFVADIKKLDPLQEIRKRQADDYVHVCSSGLKCSRLDRRHFESRIHPAVHPRAIATPENHPMCASCHYHVHLFLVPVHEPRCREALRILRTQNSSVLSRTTASNDMMMDSGSMSSNSMMQPTHSTAAAAAASTQPWATSGAMESSVFGTSSFASASSSSVSVGTGTGTDTSGSATSFRDVRPINAFDSDEDNDDDTRLSGPLTTVGGGDDDDDDQAAGDFNLTSDQIAACASLAMEIKNSGADPSKYFKLLDGFKSLGITEANLKKRLEQHRREQSDAAVATAAATSGNANENANANGNNHTAASNSNVSSSSGRQQ